MKKTMAFVLLICCLLTLVGCKSNGPIEGTEETYSGTVVDHAMSVVHEGDRHGREYISIELEDGTIELFWVAGRCETDAGIGDYVKIESAVEENTNLQIATQITVLEVAER